MLIFHTCHENVCTRYTKILRFHLGERRVLPLPYGLSINFDFKKRYSFFGFINQNNIFKRTEFFYYRQINKQ